MIQNSNSNTINQLWVFEYDDKKPEAVYEPFDYPAGALLSLSGDDDNGWDGYWTVYEGLATDMILAPPVDHAGLSTTGNRLTANLSTATGLRASRKLNPKWNDDGDAIWISFLLETNIPDGNLENWIGLSLFNGFDKVVCHLGNKTGISASFDEIRIGKTFEAVATTGLKVINTNNNRLKARVDSRNKTIIITYVPPENEDAVISFFDVGGRMLLNEKMKITAGQNQYFINMEKMSINTGVYLVTLKTKNTYRSTKVLVY
jgi:hypothetical protein